MAAQPLSYQKVENLGTYFSLDSILQQILFVYGHPFPINKSQILVLEISSEPYSFDNTLCIQLITCKS